MDQRCRVHRLATTDLDRAVDDPALGLMLAKGWTVIAPLAIEEKNEIYIALILAPPNGGRVWKMWASVIAVGIFCGIVTLWVGSHFS